MYVAVCMLFEGIAWTNWIVVVYAQCLIRVYHLHNDNSAISISTNFYNTKHTIGGE